MSKRFIALAITLILALLAPLIPACACSPALPASAYTAVIPAVFQSGAKQAISIALFAGEEPTSGRVVLTLEKDGKEVTHTQRNIEGNGQIPIDIPDIAEGDYTLKVSGNDFNAETKVKVANNFILFLETDKPIYKPGQTLHMRVMSLDPQLKPTVENVTIDVLDAKGIKVFRDEVRTDEYGMATLDLPISTEPNLGTWKINASSAKAKTELDVKVEEYVLPKYEVKVDLPKDWYLVNEAVKGKVTATYSFGKPVKGELEIKATKYVGNWQNYASVKIDIDGQADFTIPAAQYVAGVPGAQGNGNVKLEYTVTEDSTGYQEKSDSLLTVSQSSINLSIIPEGSTFKPGLPYSFLVISETPDNKVVDTSINARISYLDKDFQQIKDEVKKLVTSHGKALFEINPPMDSVALTIDCNSQNASAAKTIEAAYSPTGNFIHLEQTSEGTPNVGEDIKFHIYSTREARNFYYEVISRGTVVFSNYTKDNEITVTTTPAMAPSAKLLVYQILPNSEVAADSIPFNVTAQYPQNIKLSTSVEEAKPGDEININIQTEGEAQVGLVAVDKSVFILAENRMNLQQVFDELEKLYMQPQAELHEINIYDGIQNKGAKDVFSDAGMIVLTNIKVPEGKKYDPPMRNRGGLGMMEDGDMLKGAVPPAATMNVTVPATTAALAPMQSASGPDSGRLAEVQRVRQYFPETWIWELMKTDANGKAISRVTVPDSITTWMLRAVAISKDKGLGIAETQFKVFQPFFLTVDLPYSAIRGEEFPISVAIYNYLDQPQEVTVELQPEDWFELLDDSQKTITVQAGDIGSAKFMIRPAQLGNANQVKVTARSSEYADAVIKPIIIEPEGVAREDVQNFTLSDGKDINLDARSHNPVVAGSERTYLAVTSSYLTQTMDGLEGLIQMPCGCGEQNMIIFAPDVYITKYLQSSGQLKPEIMAKAEKLMLTGYQRELTYRRTDGSFSAFGMNDKEGSLWLTAFVLKCFSEAKGLIYIDDQILNDASKWILSHQNSDGSFDAVGFIHHQDMMGGVQGKPALTAYVAVALIQSGETSGAARAIRYLEGQIDNTDDPYAVALISYALELGKSNQAGAAYDKLMKLAVEDENGLHWGSNIVAQDNPQSGLKMMPRENMDRTSTIEATAYGTLALVKHGDNLNAGRAAKWLVSKRNALGGYGSTQDTVMALQALVEYSTGSRSEVDLTVTIKTSQKTERINVNAKNYDVLQMVEIPVSENVKISVEGQGEAIGQIVDRYNVPAAVRENEDILKIDVKYDADQVEVNDEVKVSVDLTFNPPEPMEAGMLVVDVAVPTGFAAVKDSIEEMLQGQEKIKRYDISGRKVIFYIENMFQGDKVSFEFNVKALYPVKAKGVESQAYSYYKTEYRAESLSQDITVNP